MTSLKKTKFLCYYHPDSNAILGVSSTPLSILEDYPHALVDFNLIEDFYYGNKGYTGKYVLLKTRNKYEIVEKSEKLIFEKTKNKYSIYEITFSDQHISQLDFLIYNKNGSLTLIPLFNTKLHNENYIDIFITKKNNPFFLQERIKQSIFKSEINSELYNDDEYSLYAKNTLGNIALVNNIDDEIEEPFLLLKIKELNKTILTANSMFFSKNSSEETTIKLKEENTSITVYIENLLNNFYEINENRRIIKQNKLYHKKEISISEIPLQWCRELIKGSNLNKIFYNDKKIFLLLEKNDDKIVYIISKNNPFEIHLKLNYNSDIISNTMDKYIEGIAIIENDSLEKIPTEKIIEE